MLFINSFLRSLFVVTSTAFGDSPETVDGDDAAEITIDGNFLVYNLLGINALHACADSDDELMGKMEFPTFFGVFKQRD